MTLSEADTLELQEYRANAVLREMRDISEDHWCAGWNSNLEHDLYLIVFEGASSDYGMGEIDPERSRALRAVAEKANVWWHWDREQQCPVSISLTEAKERYGRITIVSDGVVRGAKTVGEVLALYEAAANKPEDWHLAPAQPEPLLSWFPAYDGHVFFLLSDHDVELVQGDDGTYDLRYGYTSVKTVTPEWAPKNQRR